MKPRAQDGPLELQLWIQIGTAKVRKSDHGSASRLFFDEQVSLSVGAEIGSSKCSAFLHELDRVEFDANSLKPIEIFRPFQRSVYAGGRHFEHITPGDQVCHVQMGGHFTAQPDTLVECDATGPIYEKSQDQPPPFGTKLQINQLVTEVFHYGPEKSLDGRALLYCVHGHNKKSGPFAHPPEDW